MSLLEKVSSKQSGTSNAYSLKYKSIIKTILYEIYSTKEPYLTSFYSLSFRLIAL